MILEKTMTIHIGIKGFSIQKLFEVCTCISNASCMEGDFPWWTTDGIEITSVPVEDAEEITKLLEANGFNDLDMSVEEEELV